MPETMTLSIPARWTSSHDMVRWSKDSKRILYAMAPIYVVQRFGRIRALDTVADEALEIVLRGASLVIGRPVHPVHLTPYR